MLTLATADTLAGGASAASEVTCTIFGMERNGATETYKVLDQRQLSNVAGTIYTAPASNVTFVRSITVVNTNTTTARTFQLFRGGTAAANAITPVYTLPAGGMGSYEDGKGWQFFSQYGQMLSAAAPFGYWGDYNYGIAGSKAETIPRNLCPETNATGPTTGQICLTAIYLNSGTVVSNISYASATTAAGTPTHYNFGLYSTAFSRLATGTDQTSTAWAANTVKTLAMQSPYTVVNTGLHYVAYMMTASTMPTLKGSAAWVSGALRGQPPALQGIMATTYSTGDCPATVATMTNSTTASQFWACVT